MSLGTELILASSSPRRRELMELAGYSFKVRISGCDETPVAGEGPKEMVERLAHVKAAAVAKDNPDALVIGADTTVFVDGEALGKPLDSDDACRMLARLSGRTHEVWGGVAVVLERSGAYLCTSFVTRVRMVEMTAAAIRGYVSTGEPMDKAGAYAIQGIGLQFVDSIEGSYSNVVGLNIAALREILASFGVLPGVHS